VRGICRVTNLIAVEPRIKVAADLGDRVHEAMVRMADLDARSIGVAAADGRVELRGSVRTFAERRMAERVAAAAPGVREVKNELVVTP
jgi:osmotically-inducible protein OsmY